MINLVIKNREGIVFQGDVDTITSYNKNGTYDILKDHANFISIVEKQILIHQNGATRQFTADNGLIKVKGNQVWIYLGIK